MQRGPSDRTGSEPAASDSVGAGSGRQVVAVVGTRYPDLEIERRVLAPVGAELRRGPGRSAEEIVAVAGDADVVLAGASPRFDAGTLARLRCRGIVRYGVGTERIDLAAAAARGMWVARVADYGTEIVAAHAVTLAMAALRGVVPLTERVRGGGWGFDDLRPMHAPSALTAGVVGFGRIGRRAAELLATFGFRVLAHDAFVSPDLPGPEGPVVTAVGLEDLLAASDVVTLHVPGDPAGRPLLTAERLALLRPGSVLVNTARGGLIDEAALAAGLRRGAPAVAALDVFAEEPTRAFARGGPFADVADRMLLTPHTAWYTEESETELRRQAADAALRLLRGERPRDVVVEPGAEAGPAPALEVVDGER